jgi:hypothetical protein
VRPIREGEGREDSTVSELLRPIPGRRTEEECVEQGLAPPDPARAWAGLRERLAGVADDPAEYGLDPMWRFCLWWVVREMDETGEG